MVFFRILTLLGAGLQLLVVLTAGLAMAVDPPKAGEMIVPVVLLGVLAALSLAGLGSRRHARIARVGSIIFNGLAVLISGFTALGFMVQRAEGVPPEEIGFLVGILILASASLSCFVGLLGFRPVAVTEPAPRPRRVGLGRVLAVGGSVLGTAAVGLVAAVTIVIALERPWEQRVMHPPMQPARKVHLIHDEDLNYSFGAVQRPWALMPRDQWGRAARLMLSRGDPEMIFMIVAESLPEGQFTTESYAEFALNNVRRYGTVALQSSEAHSADELAGRRMVSDVRIDRTDYRYVHWVCVRGGFAYQLITRGPREDAEQVEAEAEMLLGRFRVLDLDKSAAPMHAAIEPYTSQRWGYRVDLSELGWSEMQERSLPSVEFEAARGAARVAVIPVSLMGAEPRSDALSRALLHAMTFEFPGPAITGVRIIDSGGVTGREVTAARQIQSHWYEYRLHAIRGRKIAYLIAAWQLRTGSGIEMLDEAIAAVAIDVEAAPPAIEDMTAEERSWQGAFMNQLGLSEFNRRRYERASELFRAAAEVDQDESQYVQNVAESLYSLGRVAEALEYVQAHASRHAGNPGLIEIEARLRVGAGDAAGAIESYEQLLATGHADEEHAAELIRVLTGEERLERAREVIDEHIEPGTTLHRTLSAGVLVADGDEEGAVVLLREELEAYPGSEAAAEALFDIYYEANRFHEAIDVCDRALERTPTVALYYWRALAESGLGWYPQAQASLRLAQGLSPSDPEIRRLLDDISTQLGQGDTTAVREPIEPVLALPELMRADPAPPDDGGSGVIYDYRIAAIEFAPGQRLRTTEYQRARMVDRRGVDLFSTLRFRFDPATERLFVNSVVVYDRDGKQVWEGDVSNYYVMDDGAGDAASQKKILHIPVGGLAPGRAVEAVVTRMDRQASERMPFQEHMFMNYFAVSREAVLVRADPAHVAFRADPTVEASVLPDGLLFTLEDLAVFRTEPLQPALRTFVPSVRLGSSGRDWGTVGRQYLDTIAARLEVTDGVRSLAERLVADATSDQERIALLAAHVQGDLTYRAIAFGPRAYLPTHVDEIVANSSGDCKDHALLLHLLLKAVGIESHLALVDTRKDVEPDLPSVYQFNHLILLAPPLGDDWFIDATDKHTNVLLRVPYALEERTALVLDPAQPRLVRIPPSAEDSSSVRIDRRIRIGEAGDVVVTERLELDGYTAGWLREALAYLDPSEYASELQVDYAMRWQVQVMQAEAENVFEPARPLIVRLEYRVADALHRVKERLVGVIPAPFERLYLARDPALDRWSPFYLGSPLRLTSKVTVEWPEGAQLAQPPEASERSGPFGRARLGVNAETSQLVLEIEATLPAGTFPPEQYAAYCEAGDVALRMFEPPLVIAGESEH